MAKAFDREGSAALPVGLTRHMHALSDYGQAFSRLQASWDTLALLGQLSGDATEMSGTRSAFEGLTTKLLDHLGRETLAKVVADLRTRAQNTIDVLVRNLFERTADIGFLATDTDLREFLEGADETAQARQAIERRFADYVAKYSVYSDIVLIDPEGRVRARLAGQAPDRMDHPILAEALGSTGSYVEHYGVIDGLAGRALSYAWRVESATGRPLGVLVLVFRLADEMAGIFHKLLGEDRTTVLACIAGDGRVVASSCGIQLPEGASLPIGSLDHGEPILQFGGRRYLAVLARSGGYQGYLGPGWGGVGLVPIEAAFEKEDAAHSPIDEAVLRDLTARSTLFPDDLRAVSREAASIQRDLSRSVWNGSVRQAGSNASNAAFSKILLQEISAAGRKTRALFDASIGDLHHTVVATMIEKCRSRAAFAIDVMDRNLYERANDCRWWALNATLARMLDAPRAEAERVAGEVLEKINALYTVYTNLILFDAERRIVAVSQPDQSHLIGTVVEAEWAQRALALRSGEDYAVSAFEASALYDGAPTLIYAAAVRQPGALRASGAIAIVFDATPQFHAILDDALPRDERGVPLPGALALFVDRQGRVLASSDGGYRPGMAPPLPAELLARAAAGDAAELRQVDGRHVAIGAVRSQGYREYKTSDGHDADVAALCLVPLGDVGDRSADRPAADDDIVLARPRSDAETIELATFHAAGHWLAVHAVDVVMAVDAQPIKPSARPDGSAVLVGYKLHDGAPVPVLSLARLLGSPGKAEPDGPIVIVRSGPHRIGLLVDRLGPIPELPAAALRPLAGLNVSAAIPALGLIATSAADGSAAGTLILLDLAALARRFERDPALLQAAE